MKSVLYLCALALVLIFATWAYQVNYRTKSEMDHVSQLQREIAHERQILAVLRAEWAYLNRPERLRALVEMNFADLRLMPLHADHFAKISDVAMPRPPMPDDIDGLISGLVDTAAREAEESEGQP
ncbi:MAG: cell division protein FtsL [Paracoccaceae bacterium]